jgi:hypothetical protein
VVISLYYNSPQEERMKRISIVAAFLFIILIFVAPGFAYNVWLDDVISFNQPEPDSYTATANDPLDALGEDDNNYVAIDIPETLILAFTDNTAFDDDGFDLRIREYGSDGAAANVYGSANGSDWTLLIQAVGSGYTGNYCDIFVDLDGSELNYVNYLKFEGLDDKGGFPGFDLDAVEALNSGAHVPIPGAIWLFGSGLIGLLAFRRKLKK